MFVVRNKAILLKPKNKVHTTYLNCRVFLPKDTYEFNNVFLAESDIMFKKTSIANKFGVVKDYGFKGY